MMKTTAPLALLALAAPLTAQTIHVDVNEIPQSIGGTQKLFLTAGMPFAFQTYFVAGTLSGTAPGIFVGGFPVPLNPDFYFFYTTSHPNSPVLSNSFGSFDINGFAQANFTLPAGYDPSLVGMTASHAYLTLDPLTFAITGASDSADCMLTPGPPPPTLVINEVDYDQYSSAADDLEFVEILNVSSQVVDLSNLQMELVDGGAGPAVYGTAPLALAGSTLAPGEYLVLADSAVTVPPGVKKIVMGTSDTLRDGPMDVIRIVDTVTLQVIDAMGYEGTVPGYSEGSSDMVSDLPDIPHAALERCPNGADTDDNDTDFKLYKVATPGADNTCG